MSSSPITNTQSGNSKLPNSSTRFAPEQTTSTSTKGYPVDPQPTPASSMIGNDLTILGEKITIISQNQLQVSGQIHGDVHGKQVMISKGGSVNGKVCAERIDVSGEVHGSIQALTVALHGSAKVDGDIKHQSLSISEGAEFDGGVRRAKDESELIPILDAEALASQFDDNNEELSNYETSNGEASLGVVHPVAPRVYR